MKLWFVAIVASLFVSSDANKQLLCKAGEGSVLHFFVRDNTQSMNCIANSSDFEVTKDQYDNIVRRLEAAENELTVIKLALTLTRNVNTPGSDTSTGNQTQQLIDDAVNKTISKLIPTLVKDITIRYLTNTGWRKSGDFMFKVFTERVNYNTANTSCQREGGRLAAEVLRHPDVVRYIMNGNFAVTYTDGREPWIGYNDIQTESSWIWVDGGETNPSTTKWNKGEPNNSDGNEDCGSIAKASGGKILLNDAPCSSKLHYICEIDTNLLE